MAVNTDLTWDDWDLTIDRAARAPHAEQKLLVTIRALNAAMQRSRLRGDTVAQAELRQRLDRAQHLLDHA